MNILLNNNRLIVDFLAHLDDDGNCRTLLSGPFGTGKSTFISQVAKDPVNEEYFFVKIMPVNYSIASNDDVFDLIKFDLIIELLDNYGEYLDFQPVDFPLLLVAQAFIDQSTKLSTLPRLFSAFQHATESYAEYAGEYAAILTVAAKLNRSGKSLLEEFKKFKKEIETNGEGELIRRFMESQEGKPGPNESDSITQLIFELLSRIKVKKANEGNRLKSVLVVDDMDRLDPEHIFRLFNIFSAHQDPKDDTNKFGFDKIVFVCDIENIRKIYFHRYGQDVDFAGYIDKFFSKEPFVFDNRKLVIEQVEKIISDIGGNKVTDKFSNIQKRENVVTVLELICSALITSKHLNLRMLFNFPAGPMERSSFRRGYMTEQSQNFDVIVLFYILKRFYHSWEVVHAKLVSLQKAYISEGLVQFMEHYDEEAIYRSFARMCLPFIISDSEYISKMKSTTAETNVLSPIVGATFTFTGYISTPIISKVDANNSAALNPFYILLTAFEQLRKKNILK